MTKGETFMILSFFLVFAFCIFQMAHILFGREHYISRCIDQGGEFDKCEILFEEGH